MCRVAGIPLPSRQSDAIVNSSFVLLTTHGLLLDENLVAFALCESWEWHIATSAADLQSRPATFKLHIRHALVSPQSDRMDDKDMVFHPFVVDKPTDPVGLTLEAWAEGFLVGSLVIMFGVALANMRRNVLLHKLILIEVSICLMQ